MNYQTLIMMLSDAPRYVRVSGKSVDKDEQDEANEIVSFFQSNLKQ